jgi:8-oxo-dGTP diphosphatase
MRKLIKNWEKFLGEAKRKDWDSAHAVLIKGKKTLLVQRANNDTWMPGKWGFAGGQIDKNETLEEGLKREIQEETGYSVELEDLAYLPEISYKKKHAFYACKRCVGKLEINANGVHEHEDAKWVDKSEIKNIDTVPDVKDVVIEAFKILGV